jgi:cytidyltransferase-like protein
MTIGLPQKVVVAGVFDDLRSAQLRFLEEASRLGEVTVLLWPDEAVEKITGQPPKFPEAERLYFLNAVRYVSKVVLITDVVNSFDELPDVTGFRPDVWADVEGQSHPKRKAFCEWHKLAYRVFNNEQLKGFSDPTAPAPGSVPVPAGGRKKVVVTGSYDWFHSGHVRFFEEVSAYGDLYVVVGHDANIRLLKGPGHPLLSQGERRYVVGSIKYVKQALISSGAGWLDADPEIQMLKPDIYAVNEDGDKGGKREYCKKNGIQYLVLKRTPAPGLPKRSSTNLRGF